MWLPEQLCFIADFLQISKSSQETGKKSITETEPMGGLTLKKHFLHCISSEPCVIIIYKWSDGPSKFSEKLRKINVKIENVFFFYEIKNKIKTNDNRQPRNI